MSTIWLWVVNAYPKNTPKYGIDDVIDFLDNLYDVVFMTYEADISAYGTEFPSHIFSFLLFDARMGLMVSPAWDRLG